ncbi:thiamine pyrophosphate-dependent enzyme [Aeromicrobium chenweiae]|uniref:2-oxoisovalerate dehydrogenase subunit alpha n=1 Tax=Aeromicrobium chenweiae TaxID=2079793 RepID=A0A2S0WHW2_9ACTN|nr:thiamine pyrophosphate-dependent enzyme [Aeromicrobium chenweiae]AWB90913.1 pyruvate dehydrogenase (acetyl-transferring) E1 component subunit alpha [Aeromicrobium chenweiae]TGN32132.1 pyruvate dehydrogenase (acetyl-transferring) E1 component subunit alpha [Aeromicrobium chenweiae]
MSSAVNEHVQDLASLRQGQPMFQLIGPDGTLTDAGASIGVSVELAQELHRDMVLARRLDQEALALQRQGELSLWLMSWGQEAAQVGSVRALRPTDMVFPSYREHAAALCRGISPADLMRQWKGAAHSGWNPAESRFHIYSLVLGTQTLHATGYAAGAAMEGSDEVVATYFGDGAASQGDVNEALNWAAAGSLPVLFFCQNNQWAISTPTATQMRTPLHVRAAGFGLDAFHVDGNDVMAVHAITSLAAERIRDGGGPALVEAQTYRFGGHSSSDDPQRYRSADDVAAWQLRDPLVRSEAFLRSSGVDEAYFTDLAEEAGDFAASVRTACRSITGAALESVFDAVYAEPHPGMTAERAAHLAHAASYGSEN